MDKNEILKMPAGEDMDKLIAITIIGEPDIELEDAVCPYCSNTMRFCGTRSWCSVCDEWRYSPYKQYSDEDESAFEVVDKICDEHGCDIVKVCRRHPDLLRGNWSCNFGVGAEAFGKTRSEAICRAALLKRFIKLEFPMLRVRFRANVEDPRPINWPVKHPYWVSGEGEDHAIVISYADDEAYILANWPEAKDLEIEKVDSYTFTDRFPKPKWFEER